MKFTITTALFLMIMPSTALSATYYVSTKGNDANDGLSKKTAWRTISHAAKTVKAGDVVIIEPGDYGTVNGVKFSNSGTRESPILVKAEKPGEVVFREGSALLI